MGRQYVGVGVLNTERQSSGIFNAQADDIGILGDIPPIVLPNLDTDPAYPLCQTVLGTSVQVFPWGDLSARCTRGNGFLDTEDLNGDNILNAQGPNDNVNRYVVSLTDTQYVVRKGVTDPITGAGWTLYRVPLRTPTAVIGTPNIRLVQALRVTLVAPPAHRRHRGAPGALAPDVRRRALARARAGADRGHRRLDRGAHRQRGGVGRLDARQEPRIHAAARRARWACRTPTPMPRTTAPRSTRSRFASSPGNWPRGRARRRTSGSRRATSGSCPTAQLRVWMRGGHNLPDWDTGGLLGYIKVESDANNFYMYQTPLHSIGEEEAWNPEVLVDLQIWANLRAQIESRDGTGPSAVRGGRSAVVIRLAYVACQGGYIVHILSPDVNPPNLAAAQGLSTGIIRVAAGVSDSTELWVDDVRLSESDHHHGHGVGARRPARGR